MITKGDGNVRPDIYRAGHRFLWLVVLVRALLRTRVIGGTNERGICYHRHHRGIAACLPDVCAAETREVLREVQVSGFWFACS